MQHRELKTILVSLAGSLCLAAAASAASATSAPPSGSAATSPASTGSSGTTATAAKYPDKEIVALVLTIDDNEIKAAEAAEKKKMGREATGFAKMLLKQHRADSNKVAKLAKKLKLEPEMNAAKVQELKTQGATDLQSLSAKDSLEFEQGYIGAMVQGHTDALALLDEHLIKDAENSKLKKQLEETRKHVAEHLEHAKRLQGARASR